MSEFKKDEYSVVDNNSNRQQLSTKHPWGIEELAAYLGCSSREVDKIIRRSGFPKPFDFNSPMRNGHVDDHPPLFNPLEVIHWYENEKK